MRLSKARKMKIKIKIWFSNKIGSTLYWLGFKFRCSTGMDDSTTYGYGSLDFNGYWQFSVVLKNPTNDRRKRYLSLWNNIKIKLTK